MLRSILFLLLASLCLPAEEYRLGPDSQRQPGVPQGKVTEFTWTSKIFPGTTRKYWVYVPAQYSASQPACVMIFQDGSGYVKEDGAWRAPVVLDNLIANREMPVTIGIFIDPGVMPARDAKQKGQYNRSYEYDGLGDRYARFLLEEILPEVRKQYNLSTKPDDFGIGGSSSGGIAAFTAAWNRPDAFRRVLSFIGSYTNLRGGDVYPNLIRKTEPKPLRVFLQDGEHDLNIYSGSWFLANQSMYSALHAAGYETTFVVGTEAHNAKHGGAILPDALRWLWKDYPQPVAVSHGGTMERQFITDILDPASTWELVSEGHHFTEGPAVDKDGTFYFCDVRGNRIHRVTSSGSAAVFQENSGGASGLHFGKDGRLYAAQGTTKRIVAYDAAGKEQVVADDVTPNDLTVASNGRIYFTDPGHHRVWLVDPQGNTRMVHEGIDFPNGITLSPDEAKLYVADTRSKWVWAFQIADDGSLINGEAFYHLEMPDDTTIPLRAGADGLTVDTEGYLYVATKLGVQICDQPGRVVGIINPPSTADLSNVTFGGPDRQTLYVTAGDRVYRRHLRRKGVLPGEVLEVPQPRL